MTSEFFSIPTSLTSSRATRNASRVDPMQEITRLKHSVSLLETFIIANHRNLPFKRPLDPPPSGPPSPLKKEPQDSDSVDRDNAPGMIGSQGHGGFYAGTTSVVTHLTMVCSLPLFHFSSSHNPERITRFRRPNGQTPFPRRPRHRRNRSFHS